ncbi:hypothetical protein DPX16_22349 [Anabarilius grahami]|uniref:Uncharacterized protein n=1 Tax=Anabarilius grahami TaxID=495550 RepID=A0A3N0YS50_ANAGA|nr:hypothetical protein DPX16_22349 [Anabarilius grahami]
MPKVEKRKERLDTDVVDISIDVHDYVSPAGNETDLCATSLPFTPSKPPVNKKGKSSKTDEQDDSAVISTLSSLINSRSYALEGMISANALKVEGLKKTIDFVCAGVQDLKKNVKDVDVRLKAQERLTGTCETRISDLERHSRRWNLRLFGVPETHKEDVRSEVIRICGETYPEAKSKYPDVVDTVHRIGRRDANKPRAIIMQFTSRVVRDALWKAAKNSQFLKDNNLRFAEDLTASDRERRKSLWPRVKDARAAGKTAYYIGARAFIEAAPASAAEPAAPASAAEPAAPASAAEPAAPASAAEPAAPACHKPIQAHGSTPLRGLPKTSLNLPKYFLGGGQVPVGGVHVGGLPTPPWQPTAPDPPWPAKAPDPPWPAKAHGPALETSTPAHSSPCTGMRSPGRPPPLPVVTSTA